MDNFRTRHVEKITLCFGAQLGKSEALLNMMGFAIDQDPGPMMMVYPTDELARSIAKNRLIPMVRGTDALKAKWLDEKSEILEVQFMDMYIALVGSNSPSKLASRPVRYIFFDEVDKFPAYSGSEGSPLELAAERTKNFYNRKLVEASTPTYTDGHIWRGFCDADIKKQYFVPCPHCGEVQVLKLSGIKWPEELNIEGLARERERRVLSESWYECAHCGARLYDKDKAKMLQRGEWRAVEFVQEAGSRELVPIDKPEKIPSRPRHIAYNLSSLYSPWVTFGQAAQKFLSSKNDQPRFMNFVNSWLAEPWEARASKLRSDLVMERQAGHERGTVPSDAMLLTCGIDVQLDCFWFTVRAWAPGLTSWLVDFGRCETWSEINELLDREYKTSDGQRMMINLAFMDSGDRTDEVYQFCATRPEVLYPCKGASNRLARAPFTESVVDKTGYEGLKLFVLDTFYFKSAIAGRLQRGANEQGAFLVCRDDGWLRSYAEQLCSEHLVQEQDKSGRIKELWKPITAGAPNHLLDCEVYALAAAERAGVRYLAIN